MGRTVAQVRRAHVKTLHRRMVHLAGRVDKINANSASWDRAELSALKFVLHKAGLPLPGEEQ